MREERLLSPLTSQLSRMSTLLEHFQKTKNYYENPEWNFHAVGLKLYHKRLGHSITMIW